MTGFDFCALFCKVFRPAQKLIKQMTKPLYTLLFMLSAVPCCLNAQTHQSDPNASATSAPVQQQSPSERPVSWKSVVPNIGSDQAKVWLFPAKLTKKRVWIPTALILGTTAALIALDSQDAPYFHKTSSFSGYNRALNSNATGIGTAVVPASLYVAGFFTKNSKAKTTALLAGEAVADTEILATVLKDSFRRARPASLPINGNYWDTWFDHKGSAINSNSSMPSGHTIAAFAVATVIARQYGNHRWVPYVSYGLAAAVGFSRVTLSAHFVSDVFVGGALGYSVSRFAVLRQ